MTSFLVLTLLRGNILSFATGFMIISYATAWQTMGRKAWWLTRAQCLETSSQPTILAGSELLHWRKKPLSLQATPSGRQARCRRETSINISSSREKRCFGPNFLSQLENPNPCIQLHENYLIIVQVFLLKINILDFRMCCESQSINRCSFLKKLKIWSCNPIHISPIDFNGALLLSR